MIERKPIEKIHEGQREQILETNIEQARELKDSDATVTCPCGAEGRLKTAYQCYYCGVFFCPNCAETHFGEGNG